MSRWQVGGVGGGVGRQEAGRHRYVYIHTYIIILVHLCNGEYAFSSPDYSSCVSIGLE